MPQHEIEVLRTKATRLRQSLIVLFEEKLSIQYPAYSPEDLIRTIISIIEATENSVKEFSALNDVFSLKQTCVFLEAISVYLTIFDNAHSIETPNGLVKLVEFLLDKLQPNSKLILFPQASYNYQVEDVLSTLKYKTQRALLRGDQLNIFPSTFLTEKLYVVSFPKIERKNILMYAIFGHEIGHQISNKFFDFEGSNSFFKQLASTIIDNVKNDPEMINWVRQNFDYSSDINLIKTKAVDEVTKRRNRAVDELIADHISILSFGPSALFCGYDFHSSNEMNDLDETKFFYPPPLYRLRHLYKACENQDFIRALDSLVFPARLTQVKEAYIMHITHIKSMINTEVDITNINSDLAFKYAYSWVDQSIDKAFEFSKQNSINIAYNSALITAEICELVERISYMVPPNEYGIYPNIKTPAPQSAILAAWLISLTKMYFPEEETYKKIKQKDLENITMYAVENIILKNEYLLYLTEKEKDK